MSKAAICFGLDSLEKRRHISQIMFVASLISNAVDSHIILSSLHFYVPIRSLGPRAPLFVPNRRTSDGLNDPFLRAVRFFNSCAHLVDHYFSYHPSDPSSEQIFNKFRY